MKNFLSRLIPPSVPCHTEEEKELHLRDAVTKTSTGNVLLQFGAYCTATDIAKLKKEVLG
jgi:hypothetical protein